MKSFLAFDIGATNTKWSVITDCFELLDSGFFKTPQSDADSLISTLAGTARLIKTDFDAICVSILGTVTDGVIENGGNLPFMTGTDLKGKLSRLSGLEVGVENDGKCNTLGELAAGSLAGCRNRVSIVLGTGIGSGIIIDRKLYKGHRNNAGEVGYSYLHIDKAPDMNYVAGMRNSYMGLMERVRESTGKQYTDTYAVFADARSGNEKVLSGIRHYCRELAGLIWNIAFTLDPERISVGGGITGEKLLCDMIARELNDLCDSFPLPVNKPCLVFSKLGNTANLFGAVKAFMDGDRKA